MPTATITLPRRMVDAANSYAAKESVSLVELFGLLLKRQYGYSMSVVVESPKLRNPFEAARGCCSFPKGVSSTDELIREMRGC